MSSPAPDPDDCAEMEKRLATGVGLLVGGGASRGNLFSGEADATILTVSRLQRREEGEPRLPQLLRERVQRHPGAGAVLLRGGPGVGGRDPRHPPRRAAAGPPGRQVPVHQGRDVRGRARPDRARCALGHDARAGRGVCHLLELRRGRPPLRPGAGRHAGGAAQARRAVRADHARMPLRAAALPDRGALRPRSDAGRHLPPAQRLRAGRPRAPLAGVAARLARCQVPRRPRRWSATR